MSNWPIESADTPAPGQGHSAPTPAALGSAPQKTSLPTRQQLVRNIRETGTGRRWVFCFAVLCSLAFALPCAIPSPNCLSMRLCLHQQKFHSQQAESSDSSKFQRQGQGPSTFGSCLPLLTVDSFPCCAFGPVNLLTASSLGNSRCSRGHGERTGGRGD